MIIKDYYPKYVVTLNELDTGAAMALAELCFDTLMEVAKAACAERGYTSQYAIYKLHRRVYLQRLRQQMRMADIILERNKRSIIFFVQK